MPYREKQAKAIAGSYRRRGERMPPHVRRAISKAFRGSSLYDEAKRRSRPKRRPKKKAKKKKR